MVIVVVCATIVSLASCDGIFPAYCDCTAHRAAHGPRVVIAHNETCLEGIHRWECSVFGRSCFVIESPGMLH